MKKLALVLLISLLLAPDALSFTIIKDIDEFYSMFGSPQKIIDFLKLKDGTSIEKILAGFEPETSFISGSDSCMILSGEKSGDSSLLPLAVSSQAFSDDWCFRGAHPTIAGLYCEVIIWFDQGITTGNYKMAVSVTAGDSEPFVMYTNKGFIGIIPTSPKETDFIFDNFTKVFGFETRFSKDIFTPEPIKSLDQNSGFLAGHRSKKFKR